MTKIEVENLMRKSGKSKMSIYNIARKLGRKPTIEEVMNIKRGRPPKYK